MAFLPNSNLGTTIGSIATDTVSKQVLDKLPSWAKGPVGELLPGLNGVSDFTNSSYKTLINKRLTDQHNIEYAAFTGAGGSDGANIQNYDTQDKLKESYDWRARLRPKKGGIDMFYGLEKLDGSPETTDFLMKPIYNSNGLVWQYTPSIYVQTSAEYNSPSFQGANYNLNTFNNSSPADISVTCDFTANDQYEARYFLAMQMFLKVATKAHFGDESVADGNYGIPPPVLLFEYLGDYGFNKVPVVVKNYTIEYSQGVDYVPVYFNKTVTYVPTKSTVTVVLSPTYTPHKLRKRFDIETIANGRNYKDGFI